MRNSKKSDKEGQCLLLPGGSRDKSWACPVATEALGIPSAHRTHRAGATSPPEGIGLDELQPLRGDRDIH